jgi:hypothetical protein
MWVWILVGLVLIGLFILNVFLSRAKCPNCKKRNCAETGRKETRREQVLFEQEEVIKHVDNKKGLHGGAAKAHAQLTSQFGAPDSTTIRKYKVPGERIHYLVNFKCNNCAHVFTGTTYVDNKPPTVR